MKKKFVFLILLCSCNRTVNVIDSLNLDFEHSNNDTSLPKNWRIEGSGVNISMDSLEKQNGKYSIKMESSDISDSKYGRFIGRLPIETFAGKSVEYKGWVKIKNNKNAYAGLWFSVERSDGTVDYKQDRSLNFSNNWTQVYIKQDVNKDAENITFGGLFSGEGLVWFDNLEIYIEGEKYFGIIEPEPKITLTQKELSALKKYIYPLRTYESDRGDSQDLKILDKLIGSSKVVALGEVSHGSSEIFKMKNRIIQYLAENNGFNVFSIEANMPESYKLNDYTIQGKGEPKSLIKGMYFWTWRTEELLNMVEWMRTFNQPTKRIEFTGFDMQFHIGAIDELLDMFQGNKEVENKIIELKMLIDERKYSNRDDEIKKADSIISFLQKSIEASAFQLSAKTWLEQNLVIIRQNVRMGGSAWRDKCMADNFLWIKKHNPNSKFVIWAHNTHIQETNQMMGSYLAQNLGDDYATFGFVFFDGSFTTFYNNALTSYITAQAYPGTLEYLLNQLNEPIFILDLKKIKSENNKDTKWLLKRINYRRIGGTVEFQNEYHQSEISDDFDYLIFIKTSSPSTLLFTP